MQKLTELALIKARNGVFTRAELNLWAPGTAAHRDGLLKRAMATGEVRQLRRGLYCLADRFMSVKLNPFVLAQRIYGPSYISVESALSYHGWIPEATYSITSVCYPRSREFDTPLGHFVFTRVPQQTLFAGVERFEIGQTGEAFMLASPIKALSDYVYIHKCAWDSSHPLVESLRIEEENLAELELELIDSLITNTNSVLVRKFLHGLAQELSK